MHADCADADWLPDLAGCGLFQIPQRYGVLLLIDFPDRERHPEYNGSPKYPHRRNDSSGYADDKEAKDQKVSFLNARHPLCPPNPKDMERAIVSSALTATFGV